MKQKPNRRAIDWAAVVLAAQARGFHVARVGEDIEIDFRGPTLVTLRERSLSLTRLRIGEEMLEAWTPLEVGNRGVFTFHFCLARDGMATADVLVPGATPRKAFVAVPARLEQGQGWNTFYQVCVTPSTRMRRIVDVLRGFYCS